MDDDHCRVPRLRHKNNTGVANVRPKSIVHMYKFVHPPRHAAGPTVGLASGLTATTPGRQYAYSLPYGRWVKGMIL